MMPFLPQGLIKDFLKNTKQAYVKPQVTQIFTDDILRYSAYSAENRGEVHVANLCVLR